MRGSDAAYTKLGRLCSKSTASSHTCGSCKFEHASVVLRIPWTKLRTNETGILIRIPLHVIVVWSHRRLANSSTVSFACGACLFRDHDMHGRGRSLFAQHCVYRPEQMAGSSCWTHNFQEKERCAAKKTSVRMIVQSHLAQRTAVISCSSRWMDRQNWSRSSRPRQGKLTRVHYFKDDLSLTKIVHIIVERILTDKYERKRHFNNRWHTTYISWPISKKPTKRNAEKAVALRFRVNLSSVPITMNCNSRDGKISKSINYLELRQQWAWMQTI